MGLSQFRNLTGLATVMLIASGEAFSILSRRVISTRPPWGSAVRRNWHSLLFFCNDRTLAPKFLTIRERKCLGVAVKAGSTIPRRAQHGTSRSLTASSKVPSLTSLPLYAVCRKMFWRKSALTYLFSSCTLCQKELSGNGSRRLIAGFLASRPVSIRKGSRTEERSPAIME